MRYRAIVIGASTGGIEAIRAILTPLHGGFAVPIVIVQHRSPHSDNYMVTHLNGTCRIDVVEVEEKEKILPGCAYIAPPNYHVLLEKDETLSLTVEPKENYSRPSIDILFESAADAYGNSLIGIILTGANSDGSKGIKRIKELGGLAIVQDPKTAVASLMPKAAIEITAVDYILSLNEISNKLLELIGDANE